MTAPARRISLVPLTLKRALPIVDAWHRHHRAPTGGLFAVGAEVDEHLFVVDHLVDPEVDVGSGCSVDVEPDRLRTGGIDLEAVGVGVGGYTICVTKLQPSMDTIKSPKIILFILMSSLTLNLISIHSLY